MLELDNGIRFVTNFRYNHKSDADVLKDESYESDCSQTMVGIV